MKMAGMGRAFRAFCAFRAEGLSGSTNRGLYRVHQFTKVELFALTRPTESMDISKTFIDIQVSNMPTEELGAPAHIKYDMEAWMPGRKPWGEISSTSNCTDYQSRRRNIRCFSNTPASISPVLTDKPVTGGDDKGTTTEFVHTVNGTACAVPRLLIALLETHQDTDGNIHIPAKLRPYFLGENVKILPVGKTLQEIMADAVSK
ncbi:hypothetical protein BASA50_003182 [Batrachochytrium salamandrivorans]|uniref:Aminoacyl-transfer RNA synthetases class-II family profile domain-containing protein n=1 Tax=Batrachochytrium salamandrivorans TaxID=1357716 RepID=A0ABQ8FJ94_9FUNG|nr:hypothetical protein BASA50_003182 [Batrachochytrium salamandrivorans]